MKHLILAMFLFCKSLTIVAQISFPNDIIVKNKIVKASEYIVVSKNNEEFYKHPVGLMLLSETTFDNNGMIISFFSPDGASASHSESKNIHQNYFYKDDRIVRMSQVDFDSISIEYLYFDTKNMILKLITNDKNERIKLEIVYGDIANAQSNQKVSIDFQNTTKTNGYIRLSRTNVVSSHNSKKLKVSRKLLPISMDDLKTFKSSTDIPQIEQLISKMDMTAYLDNATFETILIYNKKQQLIKEVADRVKIKYFYDNKGLLLSRKMKYKRHSFKFKFIYSSRTLSN